MERVFNNRFAQIMELLQQQGLSLSMSSKSGFGILNEMDSTFARSVRNALFGMIA